MIRSFARFVVVLSPLLGTVAGSIGCSESSAPAPVPKTGAATAPAAGASTASTPASPAAPAAAVPGGSLPQTITLSPEEMKTGGITVAAVEASTATDSFETPAVLHVDESRTARIGARVDGVVVDANVQAGARVARGAKLASIHSHMVHEAWAEFRQAHAERRKAAAELAFHKDAEGRASRLLAAKAGSRQEVDRARADRAAAEEALVIANSGITRALEELEHLGIAPGPADGDASGNGAAGGNTAHRETVPVTATYGGVVLERLVTAGTAVTAGTPLFVVSDLSTLWAVAELEETRLSSLVPGARAELTVAAHPERVFQGRIVAIGDTINPETRRVTARIEVANRDGALKPQMFATVRLSAGDRRQVVVVPADAVMKIEGQAVVFVESAAGRFEQRAVTPGAERDGRVEIRDGLTAGQRIATAGAFLIKSKFVEGAQPE